MDDGIKINTGDVKSSNHSESQACEADEEANGRRNVDQHPGPNFVGDMAACERQDEARQHGMAHAGRLTTAL